jgi:hypothetical protein
MKGQLRGTRIQAPNGVSQELFFREGTSDYSCLEQVFSSQHYSTEHFRRNPDLLDLVRRRRADGKRPLIVDAGANIGASAAFFAMTYPTARIVAIEPEANNFALLLKNTKGLNVECLNAGLASSPGRLRVIDPGEHEWGFRTEATHDDSGIPSVTIADIYRRECGSGDAFPFIV